MGRVWRATDEILDRQVAVKEMRMDGLDAEDTGTRRERTLREARATARIDHPHVVRVYDVVDEGQCLWIVMELIAGRSLERVLAEDGPLGPRETARIGLGLVAALRQVHARGVLHRDIKPGNVLVENPASHAGPGTRPAPATGTTSPTGAQPHERRVVLTDFGIAAIQDAKALTMVGMLVGSPDYMAPERISGRPQGPPSDLWSLGATLCAALGRSPFARDTTLATLHAVLYEEPDMPPTAGPLRELLIALLDKDPSVRPALTEVGSTLERVAFPAPTPTLPVMGSALEETGAGGVSGGGGGSGGPAAGASVPEGGHDGGTRRAAKPTRAVPGTESGDSAVPIGELASAERREAARVAHEPGSGGSAVSGPESVGPSTPEPKTPTPATHTFPRTPSKPPTPAAPQTPHQSAPPDPRRPPPEDAVPPQHAAPPDEQPAATAQHAPAGNSPTASHPPTPVSLTRARAVTRQRPPTHPHPTPAPPGEPPGPAVPAASRRRGGRRRTPLIPAAAAVAVVGSVVGIVLATTSGSPDDDHQAHGSSSTSAPPTTGPAANDTPSPTVEGTSRPPSPPPGAHREAGGFAWATPEGWRRDVKTGAEVHYTSPDGRQELAAKSSLARGDLLENWQTSERNARQGQDYRKIRLEETTFQGHPAVVWEYTFTLEDVHWHARLLGFNANGTSYQVNTWYQPEIETEALSTYEDVKNSFTVL
ncbi:serine/threonine-protein kinase [Streptomyces bullii]|uniref:non-specific serine/threonine protein kinase n=1 Tax=Streptomyces bullii TaxID=349910 RepID=A0ABW0UJ07_9ACTN